MALAPWFRPNFHSGDTTFRPGFNQTEDVGRGAEDKPSGMTLPYSRFYLVMVDAMKDAAPTKASTRPSAL
jgi:hypothetical protein